MVDQSIITREFLQILQQVKDLIKTEKIKQQICETIMPIVDILFYGIYNQYQYIIYMLIVVFFGMIFSIIFMITIGLYSIHSFLYAYKSMQVNPNLPIIISSCI